MKKGIYSFLVLLFCAQFSLLKAQTYPFQNPNLPIEERVNDLVGRLTLQEKINQMMNGTPAIDRLGIPAYDWWNPALHGIARAGKSTVFPQSIGMGATFDMDAMYKAAEIISDEGRAKHYKAVSFGMRGSNYGLTFWAPHINIFRDPRWGRGQETYGEDPYLTGELGVAFVKGMQGNDSKYMKVGATAKHYAVNSGPESLRHVFNARPSLRDFWETYLPAFEKLVVEGKAHSVMCAYSAYEGLPCCGSDILLKEILRNQWKFDGVVVSDCGAIGDFSMNHGTSPDHVHAAATAVKAGTDLECGYRYGTLGEAVRLGLITEAEIDVSVKRNFTVRMKLGIFDPEDMVPYRKELYPYSLVESPENLKHTLEMARKAIVLLKNDKQTLPLKKDIKTIAVVGPNADDPNCLVSSYKGSPSYVITPLQAIEKKAAENGMSVIYEQGTGLTDNISYMPMDISNFLEIDGEKGVFKAEYFNNNAFWGEPAKVEYVKDVTFLGDKQHQICDFIGFNNTPSVRWTTVLTVPKKNNDTCGEDICFEMTGIDVGFRLYIDDVKVIDFGGREIRTDRYAFQAEAGKSYKIRYEFAQFWKNSGVSLTAVKQKRANPQETVKKVASADVIVFIGGISSAFEGEESGVLVSGFSKGDRTTINLPDNQTELLKQLSATGKPIVFVILTGSAIAIKWEKENIPAIINAWYGGPEGGTAIADVLFGDYNPAGRLPVTFYESDKDLPDFEDYSMKERTYRYFTGKPLFEFGYGLSYTQFEYSGLTAAATANTNENITVKATVKNTGGKAGEEVVQLYISRPDIKDAPLCSLQGFKRIFLNAGESKQVEFTLTPKQLALFDDVLEKLCVFPGTMTVSVGGRQPSEEAIQNKSAQKTTVELVGEKY